MSDKPTPENVNKVVLAYSGGLDTSVILRWLQDEYQCEVVTFTADLGQVERAGGRRGKQGRDDGREARSSSRICARNLSVITYFRCSAPTRLYEGAYLLGTSIARPLIAKRQIEIALARPAPTPSPTAPPARAMIRCASSLHTMALKPDIKSDRAVAGMGSDEPHAAS